MLTRSQKREVDQKVDDELSPKWKRARYPLVLAAVMVSYIASFLCTRDWNTLQVSCKSCLQSFSPVDRRSRARDCDALGSAGERAARIYTSRLCLRELKYLFSPSVGLTLCDARDSILLVYSPIARGNKLLVQYLLNYVRMTAADFRMSVDGLADFVCFRRSENYGDGSGNRSWGYTAVTDRFMKYLFETLGFSTVDVTSGMNDLRSAVLCTTPLMRIVECSDSEFFYYLFRRGILARDHYPLMNELCAAYPASVEILAEMKALATWDH
jgi:hypothetical protein